jgi:hypothetical protein
MPGQEAKLHVQLDLDFDAGADELDELATGLRRQLLELDVEPVDRSRGTRPPREHGELSGGS